MVNTRVRALTRICAALVVVVPGVLLSASAADADTASPSPAPSSSPSGSAATSGPVVTFGIGPSTKGVVDRRPNYTLLAPRGGALKDEVAIVNLTLEKLTLNLYAADAFNTPDGSLALQPAAAPLGDAAAWVTFKTPSGKGFVVVPPKTTLYIPFTVRVPKDAYVGDHLAGVIASTVVQGEEPGVRTAQVKFEQRIGLRLGIRVAGELAPQLTIENLSATYAGSLTPFAKGTAVVSYTVHNTGNVRLGGHQEVSVKGVIGPSADASGLSEIPLLLPGSSAQVTVPVADVTPLGPLTATVTIEPLAALGDANPPAAAATGSTTFWAVPWTTVALLLVLVLLAGWLLRRRGGSSGPADGVGRRASGSHGRGDLVSTS